MAKKLEITGVGKPFSFMVDECMGGCPFNYDCIRCNLHYHLECAGVKLPAPDMFGDAKIPQNCPLPDFKR